MARTFAWRSAALAALAAAAFGCKEEVTAPGQCPELCPADTLVVVDTVLTGIVVSDTSLRGYTNIHFAPIMVAANTDSLEAHPLIKFAPVPQRWFPTPDTAGMAIVIDSIALELRLDARDTNVRGIKLLVYRINPAIDTFTTFDSVAAVFAGLPFDTVEIPESLRVAGLRTLLDTLAMQPSAADSFVTALGLSIIADSQPYQTAVRLSSSDGGAVPIVRYYVHGATNDTLKTVLSTFPTFDTYVQTPQPPPPAPGTLSVGNQPAARSFLRFDIPRYFVDSVNVIRATLQLTPTRPVRGLGDETFGLEAVPILRYFDGKSILIPDTVLTGRGLVKVGQTTTVEVEIARILRFWRGIHPDSLPRAIALRAFAESFSFNEIEAAGHQAGAAAPRLQITFLRPTRFGVP